MDNVKYYIAYGSDLSLMQMMLRCTSAEIVGTTELKNYRILFRGEPDSAYATVEPSIGKTVPVLIWKLTRYDEQDIDITFGGFPYLYRKETMSVEVNGTMVECMLYVMDDKYDIGIPSQQYLNMVLDGYEDCGFEPTAIEEALELSYASLGISDNDKKGSGHHA